MLEPIPDCCTEDEQCDDGDDTCTNDSCVDNRCSYALTGAANCCLTPADCNDADFCTTDVCTDHQCSHDDIPGCCYEDEDCSLDDATCWEDFCVEGVCVHQARARPTAVRPTPTAATRTRA
ncbi:MAG: hypothetical protein M5T61_20520 [Acidimicrobiia bacterium]|nr:hypothetical protein [Acidimicrobiia bacterium]